MLAPSEGGVATFTTPSERRIELPAGTMFPTVHIQEVLRARAPASDLSVTRCSMAPGFDLLTQITSVIAQPRLVEPLADHESRRVLGHGQHGAHLHAPADTPKFEAGSFSWETAFCATVLDYGDRQAGGRAGDARTLERPNC